MAQSYTTTSGKEKPDKFLHHELPTVAQGKRVWQSLQISEETVPFQSSKETLSFAQASSKYYSGTEPVTAPPPAYHDSKYRMACLN